MEAEAPNADAVDETPAPAEAQELQAKVQKADS
jgi:hypothetical protein